ncbi:carbohydrate ABC transporter permease [Amycolatopsis jejuensis]|uniref:carbohydrate ABC transporter permease n=1 Tax=Amycolatopsis jejuensis TaxID=330084 RepID=UPI000AA5CDFD|nr:carbohydrate ABC transporter permease [Amycolatopsis jejuensis]
MVAVLGEARPRQVSGRPWSERALRLIGYHGVGLTLALAFLFPLVWAFINSVKTPAEANAIPSTWLPHALSLGNYASLLKFGAGLWTYLGNSIVLAALVVVGTVVVCVLGGYGFSRFQFRGRNLLFAATLAILMVPYATILVPLYIVLGKLGLQNSVFGLAIVLIMFQLPFGMYMMRNSFDSVPRELEEAALVDGCSNFGALWRVSLRIVMPGIITVALFSFLASWNEFLAPLIFLQDGDKYTLPIMLVNISAGDYGTVDYGALQAGVVLSALPCLLLYLFLQRFFVGGLLSGALRG